MGSVHAWWVACPIPTHSMCWNHLHACRPTSTCSFDFIWLLLCHPKIRSPLLSHLRGAVDLSTHSPMNYQKSGKPRGNNQNIHRNTTLGYDKSLCTTASIWYSECHCLWFKHSTKPKRSMAPKLRTFASKCFYLGYAKVAAFKWLACNHAELKLEQKIAATNQHEEQSMVSINGALPKPRFPWLMLLRWQGYHHWLVQCSRWFPVSLIKSRSFEMQATPSQARMRPRNMGNYGQKLSILPSTWPIALSCFVSIWYHIAHITGRNYLMVDIVHIVSSPHYNLGQVMAENDWYFIVTPLALSEWRSWLLIATFAYK